MPCRVKEVIYTSELSSHINLSQLMGFLESIECDGRQKNFECNITSVFLCDGRRFVQVLEGPEIEVDDLMDRLFCDDRHENIRVISETMIASRNFPGQPLTLLNPDDAFFSECALSEERHALASLLKERILIGVRRELRRSQSVQPPQNESPKRGERIASG